MASSQASIVEGDCRRRVESGIPNRCPLSSMGTVDLDLYAEVISAMRRRV